MARSGVYVSALPEIGEELVSCIECATSTGDSALEISGADTSCQTVALVQRTCQKETKDLPWREYDYHWTSGRHCEHVLCD